MVRPGGVWRSSWKGSNTRRHSRVHKRAPIPVQSVQVTFIENDPDSVRCPRGRRTDRWLVRHWGGKFYQAKYTIGDELDLIYESGGCGVGRGVPLGRRQETCASSAWSGLQMAREPDQLGEASTDSN